ncbi:MAG: hypothetical protein HYY37_03035 [Candidatus Aenigmarchaeota archaeon]|nr:hypothetical protein [Candidatus Aenigmarchaeota archaeon]
MKGLSLPINLIVILAIAVLILVVVSAWVVGVLTSNQLSLNDNDAWQKGCGIAKARGCVTSDFAPASAVAGLYISGYDPLGNDPRDSTTRATTCSQTTITTSGCTDDTVNNACTRAVQGTGNEECRRLCCGF